jgi:hypothetical protein
MPAEYLSWVPSDVDLSKPNAARIYDYILGGANNFEVDREFAKRLLTTLPDAQSLAQENRAFLRRTVTYLVEQGIRQFIDLGSGIPTVGNTHEVVQRLDPGATVVYVDNEPVAVAHSELILEDNDNAGVVRADMRDVHTVLRHPVTTGLIDFDEPVGVLAYAIMHFVPDDEEPYRLLARYRDATVPGSYLTVSHLTSDGRPEVNAVVAQYQSSASPVTERNRADVARFFTGYELVEPGVMFTRQWRPEIELDYSNSSSIYGGVGLRI